MIDDVVARDKKLPKRSEASRMCENSLSESSQGIRDAVSRSRVGREKIDEEYAELSQTIWRLQGILDDPQKVLDVIVSELEDIKGRYGDERRTEIVASSEDIDIEDMIVEEDVVVTVSHSGYIKRNAVSLYRSQRRGGRGKVGMGTKEEDFVERIFIASTHNYILIFTNQGRVYWLKVYQIPQAGRAAKGKAIVNLIQIQAGERVAAVLPVRDFMDGKSVVMVTKRGVIKKTELAAFSNPRSIGTSPSGSKREIAYRRSLRTAARRFFSVSAREVHRSTRKTAGMKEATASADPHGEDDVVVAWSCPRRTTIATVSNRLRQAHGFAEYRVQTARRGRSI